MILIFIYYIINYLFAKFSFDIQFLQNNNFNEDYSLLFIKPENLSKTELVEKFKELSSSKSLDNLKDTKVENKITMKDLFKSYYLRLLSFILKFYSILTKITLFTILFNFLRKMKLIRFIWTIINSFLFSIFGIIFSDFYGFKEIYEIIKYYWILYVDFIHETKLYKIFSKILGVINEPVIEKTEVKNDNKLEEIQIIENKEDNSYDFPSSDQQIKTKKTWDLENHWGDSENPEINKNSPYNTYFLIVISIITVSLIYVYWDSIYSWFGKIKPDEGSNSPTVKPEIDSPTEIQSFDLTNFKIDDYLPLSERYVELSKETMEVAKKLEMKIKFFKIFNNSFSEVQITKHSTDLIQMYENLKLKQIETIEIFNKLIKLNENTGNEIFTFKSKSVMLKNINTIQNIFNNSYDVIPNYNLDLTDLPVLEIVQESSPEMKSSILDVENLNSQVEKTWNVNTPSSPTSDSSETTIKSPFKKGFLKGKDIEKN